MEEYGRLKCRSRASELGKTQHVLFVLIPLGVLLSSRKMLFLMSTGRASITRGFHDLFQGRRVVLLFSQTSLA